MKNKLKIYSSKERNLVYKIFKFENEFEEKPIEYYIQEEPFKRLDESVYLPFTESISYTLDVEPSNVDSLVSIKAPFNFITSGNTIKFKFYNNSEDIILSTLSIDIHEESILSASLSTDDTSYNISSSNMHLYIQDFSLNEIKLNKNKFNYKKVIIETEISFFSIIDEDSNGVFSPKLGCVESSENIHLFQDYLNSNNKYHYVIIAEKDNSFSKLSKKITSILANTYSDITTRIEILNPKSQEWDSFIESGVTDEVKISKKNIKIISESVPTFHSSEISFDERLLNSTGDVTIVIPNIWHKDKDYLHKRSLNKVRACNFSDNVSVYSEEISFKENATVNIKEMIVFRKNVSLELDEDKTRPIPMSETDLMIKKYKMRVVDDYSTQSDNSIPVSSRFPLINLIHYCIPNQVYNYTIYLVDELGRVSSPIIKLNR